MANTYKVLGQSAPGATTATTLYTCPSATETVVSVIVVCNRGAATTFRVGVDVNGAGDDNKDYLAYDMPIGANGVVEFGKGVTLDASDLIRVYAGSGDLSFSVFGEEISQVRAIPDVAVVSGGSFSEDATYRYYAFTSSGTLTVARAGLVDVLVVGGGGGGGGHSGGGGGAGDVVLALGVKVDAGSIAVTVGAGGTGGPASFGFASNSLPGGASKFGSLVAAAGGGGGGWALTSGTADTRTQTPGQGGASGGGGCLRQAQAGGRACGLGGDGGASMSGNSGGTGAGGGGGGMAGAGSAGGGSSVGGAGGGGVSPSGFSAFGVSGAFGGGGGGGAVNTGTGGSASAGGGAGGTGATGSNGTANTGGGGGGGGNNGTTPFAGGDGGSGVVIVRVKKSNVQMPSQLRRTCDQIEQETTQMEPKSPGGAYISRYVIGPSGTGLTGTVRYRLLDNDNVADDPEPT